MSQSEITIARPHRWDVPFGEGLANADIERLLQVEPFCHINPARFPAHLSLEGILRNDARVVKFEEGDLVIREGDYGNSAFMLLHGTVRVVLEGLSAEMADRTATSRKSWWKAIRQLWTSQQVPEVRSPRNPNEPATSLGLRGEGESARIFLQDIPRVLDTNQTAQLTAGEFFGELAALNRSPRSATLFAEGPAVLLEIRWQGLRDLMRYAPTLREHIDQLYRENSLRVHLRETPLLSDLSEAALDQVVEATRFATHGSFEWNTEMARHESLSPIERIAREPLIAEEGQPVTNVLLVRSGFARLSQRFGESHRTLAYLGKGQVFGMEEILQNSKAPLHTHSLRAVGHIDLLEIPVETIRQHLLPTLENRSDPRPTAESSSNTLRLLPSTSSGTSSGITELPSVLLDFLVDQRLVNGTEAMVIDLERCTRCDDCVRACATTHDGNPRFVREGTRFGRFQFAGACMHCVDPVCMIGCPTGAIQRLAESGVVRINDDTCIGCTTCANSCPYDNIRMAELRNVDGLPVLDLDHRLPIVKATKCDFCTDGLTGPACQNACAHDALIRIDLSNPLAIAEWMDR